MKQVRIAAHALAIGCLQFAQFIGLGRVLIDRIALVHEKIPDLFAALPRIERFVLRVADASELLVGHGRLRAVTLADQLHDTAALIDLAAQNFPEIASFRPKSILPDRFVPEESQRVGDKLAGTAQLAADRRDEDRWTRRHGGKSLIKLELIGQAEAPVPRRNPLSGRVD